MTNQLDHSEIESLKLSHITTNEKISYGLKASSAKRLAIKLS